MDEANCNRKRSLYREGEGRGSGTQIDLMSERGREECSDAYRKCSACEGVGPVKKIQRMREVACQERKENSEKGLN